MAIKLGQQLVGVAVHLWGVQFRPSQQYMCLVQRTRKPVKYRGHPNTGLTTSLAPPAMLVYHRSLMVIQVLRAVLQVCPAMEVKVGMRHWLLLQLPPHWGHLCHRLP
jgi:hypothetical protein